MTIYEFRCRTCGQHVELRSRVPEACSLCGEQLVRVWHANTSSVPGLARDRFKYRDVIKKNRQRIHDQERGA